MSCFKLPITLCNDIEQLICKFWWGNRGNQRKIHWTKWSTLCLPKDLGGMGFKELQKFNDAMLAKQVWRLLEDKTSLFHKFFKAKFFPNGSVFDAKEDKGSFAWRIILKVRMSYQRGLNGEWETVKTFLSSRTVGCLTLKTLKSNPFQPFWVVMLKFLF